MHVFPARRGPVSTTAGKVSIARLKQGSSRLDMYFMAVFSHFRAFRSIRINENPEVKVQNPQR
jgi:hypothetical protein